MLYYIGLVLFDLFFTACTFVCIFFILIFFTSYLYMYVKRFEMLLLKALYKIKFIIIYYNITRTFSSCVAAEVVTSL